MGATMSRGFRRHMQKRKIIARWAALFVLASATSLAAHHSLVMFDTTTAVTVKGTVVRFDRVNPHSFLYIDEKGKDGEMRQWVIEGPNVNQLTRIGLKDDALKAGDVIETCGYLLKEKTDRNFLTGELLVLADGRKQAWLDYGHHKCFGPDHRDMHSR
jgi:hypothetical protein